MMRRALRIVRWLVGAVLALLLAWFVWDAFLELPVARALYGDVPRLEFPTDLESSLAFRTHILDKRQYWVQLVVYYRDEGERRAVRTLMGDPPVPAVPTQFHVVVRDAAGRVIHDEAPTSIQYAGHGVQNYVRRIDQFILTRGIYTIEVMPVGDFSAFRRFRTAIELNTHPKATAIRD